MSVELSTESNAARNEEKIRQRAYEIWQSEGCPEGRENDHWDQAAREVDGAAEEPPVKADSSSLSAGEDDAGETTAPYNARSLAA